MDCVLAVVHLALEVWPSGPVVAEQVGPALPAVVPPLAVGTRNIARGFTVFTKTGDVLLVGLHGGGGGHDETICVLISKRSTGF